MLEKQQDKSMSIWHSFFLLLSHKHIILHSAYGGEILFEYNIWDQGYKDLFPFQFCVGFFYDYYYFFFINGIEISLKEKFSCWDSGDKYLLLA